MSTYVPLLTFLNKVFRIQDAMPWTNLQSGERRLLGRISKHVILQGYFENLIAFFFQIYTYDEWNDDGCSVKLL